MEEQQATALLQIRGLRVDYPGLVAVRELDLTLMPGDACALIGPNGAGKSTTMKAVCGLLSPTRGEIRICGKSLEDDPRAYRRALGFMRDDSPIYQRLSVQHFLEHFAEAWEVPNAAAKIDEMLELVGLTDKRSAECRELSRGMRQRVVLARTLLTDPAVLVLDEPANGLDPVSRLKLRDIILQLRAQGKAVLVSSHILSEIDAFSNRVLILERGQVRVSGDVQGLMAASEARLMRLRWREERGTSPREMLSAHGSVSDLKEGEGGACLDFRFEGENVELDALLKELVLADVCVAEWRPLRDALEHILVQSGAKEVN